MMTEIWWKVFLGSLLTAGLAKLAGCPLSFLAILAWSFPAWAVILIGACFLEGVFRKRRRKE
jgi:hypothetical protein